MSIFFPGAFCPLLCTHGVIHFKLSSLYVCIVNIIYLSFRSVSSDLRRIISTDEDPSLRIESSAIINLRVSTKLNKHILNYKFHSDLTIFPRPFFVLLVLLRICLLFTFIKMTVLSHMFYFW